MELDHSHAGLSHGGRAGPLDGFGRTRRHGGAAHGGARVVCPLWPQRACVRRSRRYRVPDLCQLMAEAAHGGFGADFELGGAHGGGLRLVEALKGIDRVSGFAYRGTDTSNSWPGKAMENIGPQFLGGYGSSAPLDSQGSAAIAESFTAQYDTSGDAFESWRDANDNSNGRNAVAIQKGAKFGFFDRTTILGIALYTWTEKAKVGDWNP